MILTFLASNFCYKRNNYLKTDFIIQYFIFSLGCLTNSEKKRLSVKMRSKQQAYIHVVRST